MVAEAGEPVGYRFFADPEQLDLLRDKDGRLPADALRQVCKGRGRPAGSQNKASKDIARYFVGKYGDPLDALGEIITSPVDVLYEQMKLAQGGESKSKRITGKDALALKLSAIDTVLPYIHGKQAIKVDMTKRHDVILNIPGLTDTAALAEMTAAPELGAEELERLEYLPDAVAADGAPIELVEGEAVDD